MQEKQSRFERSIETQLMVKRLLEMEDDDFVSYEELSKIVGQKVDGAYTKLKTARDIAYHEAHRVFDIVRGEGVKRLGPDESAGTLTTFAQRQQRQSRRKLNWSGDMPYDDMSQEARNKMTVSRTILAFTAEAGSKKNVKKIEEAVSQSRAELPFGKALELFK